MQLLDAACANTARREVDDTHEAGVVLRVLQQAQVGQRVFDFGPLEEAQAAIHPVRHTGVEECGFDHPALRVRAVEHGDFLAFVAVLQAVAPDQLAHLVHHPLRFGEVAGGLEHPHRLPRALRGAQVFAQAFAVVADEFVGGVEDVAVRAVVLLQLDLVLHAKFAHKVGHVAHTCAAEGVDALVVVAHGNHAVVGCGLEHTVHLVAGQLFEPGVL